MSGPETFRRVHGVTVFQDLAQIRTRYHDAAPTVVNNHIAKVVLSGVADRETLELISQLIGEEEYQQASRSTDSTGRQSVSESLTVRRLAPMDLIRRVEPGQGVLVYGSLLPIHLQLRPFHADPELRRLAGGGD